MGEVVAMQLRPRTIFAHLPITPLALFSWLQLEVIMCWHER